MFEAVLKKELRDFPLDIDLRVAPGEILVLMGENGAGKSTLLNIISGLLRPDSGRIFLNGTMLFDSANVIDCPVENRKIGYVLQNPAVFPHLTVRENISYGLVARREPGDRVKMEVDRWLKVMGIGELALVKAGNLSGGQKQKVALARAFAIYPHLLLLDEPFTALDSGSRDAVMKIVRDCVSELKIPCLVVTHRIEDAQKTGDRVVLISRGAKWWEGPALEIPG